MTSAVHRVEAIVFDIALLVFAMLMVLTATGLGPGARLVPLFVGVPVLVAAGIQLARDLRSARATEPSAQPQSRLPAKPAEDAGLEDYLAAALAEEAADELPSGREARRKQALFASWAFGYIALTYVLMELDLPGFLLTTPVALSAILFLTTRSVAKTASLAVGACVVLYLLFRVLLTVPF